MIFFNHLGQYFLLLYKVFSRPEKPKVFFKNIIKEIDKLGINSIGIVVVISIFMGAVITIQTAYNIDSPFIQKYLIGLTARDSMILEFSSTIVSLILAGKVGSNIASEIGTMRVTEQIDALEIMGVNSASHLIFPKIIATVFINPFLVILSIFIGIFGGWLGGVILTDSVSSHDYIYGLQFDFKPYYIQYTMIKTVVFAFIITSVSSYYGYFTSGGALEVGRSSTNAVVYSSVLILLFNLLLTQLLLS
ncbi:MAG: ABC transporter permease [Bacteroidetes bacterium]|jgi:phospholipid/cholesterol/gamma-HCH transport system permease protein|nr:ABC transporter permease [Bacteroidota bacterium]MBT6686668.1 ABC transporter permease [Bacteroidota bacterium]MBT7144090.1 ABC transporter permease [Bacteroidota bacterium]MBT7492267.1 ABC transporter permease [Bacteroidota bacterium]